MSELDSRVDKSISRCFYEISFDRETNLPTQVRMTVLAGLRGSTDKTLEKEEHVAFVFDYSFSRYGEVQQPELTKEVAKLIR